MALFRKKTSPRRSKVRKTIAPNRLGRVKRVANRRTLVSSLVWLAFVALSVCVIALDTRGRPEGGFAAAFTFRHVIPVTVVVVLMCVAGAIYIHHYQKRIIRNHTRAISLAALLGILLAAAKVAVLLTQQTLWATGSAVMAAIILTIAYSQRFALGISLLYCILVCLAVGRTGDLHLFLTAAAGAGTCCFSLREIRTRIKLVSVSTLAAVVVFVAYMALAFLPRTQPVGEIFRQAGLHAAITLIIGMLIQSILPIIEKTFRIATSMTLLDYSDANQPLLRRLAMEAPGTFSHSLLVGAIAEAAAEAIGRNGLLCRVGAYYHDIGKINKPDYFIENQVGSDSRHKELSPAMSQLIIVGHVKDGIEMAKEYRLPVVIRQFIETHHGTTLVEFFYNEAIKKHDAEQAAADNTKKAVRATPPSESEFRYPGPKPRTKEAGIVMLADSVEGAVRSLGDITPTRIDAVVHNIAMKRLQDGQFDECDLSLRELSQIETSISKTLAAHYHSRIAYPKRPDVPEGSSSGQARPQSAAPTVARTGPGQRGNR